MGMPRYRTRAIPAWLVMGSSGANHSPVQSPMRGGGGGGGGGGGAGGAVDDVLASDDELPATDSDDDDGGGSAAVTVTAAAETPPRARYAVLCTSNRSVTYLTFCDIVTCGMCLHART